MAVILRQGLPECADASSPIAMERQLIFDIGHPDAFKNSGKFHTALLDEADFALNRGAFAENGYSKGMFYNTYCNAPLTLADGRVYVFGGHDMATTAYIKSTSSIPKRRLDPMSANLVGSGWANDPFGLQLFISNPNAQFYPGCDQEISRAHSLRSHRSEVFALVSICNTASEWHGAGGWRVRSEQHCAKSNPALRKVFRISLRLTLRLRQSR